MTSPTRRARELAAELAEAAVSAQKAEYRARIERIEQAFSPPLSHAELSRALGLKAPTVGATGTSDIARYVSAAPRLRRARPDVEVRALIDAVADGTLLVAVQPAAPGEDRPTLVCTRDDVARLESAWTVVSVPDGPVDRDRGAGGWDDEDAWNAFGGGDRSARTRAQSEPDPRWVGAWRGPAIGLGAMRLSTTNLGEDDAVSVVLAALESGVRLIDTAPAYAHDEASQGANERLIARALREWGAADDVLVATKAGLVRRGTRWIPDGRPDALRAAVELSLAAQNRDHLDLVQLHVVDPRVPIEESVGALADLVRLGLVRAVGLCNVTTEHVLRALTVADVVSVQNAISFAAPGDLAAGDLVETCHQHGIAVVAHSPLGGHRRKRPIGADPVLRSIATRVDATPEAVALAWLASLGPGIVAIPGTTRPEAARANALAASLALPEECLQTLDATHSRAPELRRRLASYRPLVGDGAVLVMGMPASGKSTHVRRFTGRGYARFNRDERGGRLKDLLPAMDEALAGGARRIVADNTYPTVRSRQEVVTVAARHGLPTAAVWMDTPLHEALRNACERMLDRHGRLLGPEELAAAARQDPNMLPPGALHRFAGAFEPPTTDEGLAAVVRVPFARSPRPGRAALILDFDGTLRVSRGKAPFPRTEQDIEILPGRGEVLREFVVAGVPLLGVSNQSGVATGALTSQRAAALFDRTAELLGVTIDARFCPHHFRGSSCWCRKPMPGLGVLLTREHGLDPARSVYVGDMETDEEFARNAGFGWCAAEAFFGGAWRGYLADMSASAP